MVSAPEYGRIRANSTKPLPTAPGRLNLIRKLVILFYSRGAIWSEKGDYEKAIADLTKAIELDPHWACSYDVLAGTWIGQGRFDKAIQVAEKLVSIDPNLVKSHLVRGKVFNRVDRPDAAIAAFNHALQIDPNSVHAFTGRDGVDEERRLRARQSGILTERSYCGRNTTWYMQTVRRP